MAITGFPIDTVDSALTGAQGVAAIQKAHDMPSAETVSGLVDTVNYVYKYTTGLIKSIVDYGGGNGDQTEDTAAVQAMIDAGLTACYLPANENEYELLELVVPQGAKFTIVGEDRASTTIAVRGKVLTAGDVTTESSDCFNVSNVHFNIYEDITDGAFDLQFCRNCSATNFTASDVGATKRIGMLFKLDRSYQYKFENVYGRCKGISLYEVGDSSVAEVIDTISHNNVVWHSNYGIMQREGALNVHNLLFNNAKFRDYSSGEDEHTLANQGETSLSLAATSGATSITVADSATLNSGNLASGDLIYIGHDYTAEQLRVSSVVGNIINLDTPIRFNHTNDVDGTGNGEPVIFGPVFLTFGFCYSVNFNTLHLERGYIGVHGYSMRGTSVPNVFSTCLNTFRVVNKCRSWDVGSITIGNVGWGSVNIFDVPDYHLAADSIQNISIGSPVQADSGVNVTYVNNDSTQSTDSGFRYAGGATTAVTRSLTTTINPALVSTALISMNGRIDRLNISDGLLEGQELEVIFSQDANGHRNIVTTGANITMSEPLNLSSRALNKDTFKFLWDGSQWNDSGRVVYDQLLPRVDANLGTVTADINTKNKYAGKLAIRTSDGVNFRAQGSLAADDWVSLDGSITITPA